MAKIAAPSLPGSRPSIFGGSLRWNSGSATPQNNMPVAIVVQRVTANQRQRSRSGFASGPPMVVRRRARARWVPEAPGTRQNGKAAWRGRGGSDGEVLVGGGVLKKK